MVLKKTFSDTVYQYFYNLIKPLLVIMKTFETMKTFMLAVLLTASVCTTNAQTATGQTANAQTDIAPVAQKMTKAEREAAKVKKEADLVEAFTKAGLSADEQLKARAALEASNEQAKPIKADASLADDVKKEKLDAIYKQRNDNLKTIMGADKYKIFKAVQKAQKEASKTE